MGRGHLKCGSAEGRCIGADHEVHPDWRWCPFSARLGVYVEDIDPVARLRFLVVQKSPCPVCELVEVRCAQERLPGIPHRLRQSQCAANRSISLGDLELEGYLVESPLEDIGNIWSFHLAACPLRILGELQGEAIFMQVQSTGQRRNCLSVATVRVCCLQFNHTVFSGSDFSLAVPRSGTFRRYGQNFYNGDVKRKLGRCLGPCKAARYGQTSQSWRGPLLVALMVQTPRELAALTHSVLCFKVWVRNGHRLDSWSSIGVPPEETAGNTRCPNHSAMCGRDAARAGSEVLLARRSGLKIALSGCHGFSQPRQAGSQIPICTKKRDGAAPERRVQSGSELAVEAAADLRGNSLR